VREPAQMLIASSASPNAIQRQLGRKRGWGLPGVPVGCGACLGAFPARLGSVAVTSSSVGKNCRALCPGYDMKP